MHGLRRMGQHSLDFTKAVMHGLNVAVLPIVIGTIVIGVPVWLFAVIGWSLPDSWQIQALPPEVKPPWFHDAGSFASLAVAGVMFCFVSLIGLVLFVIATFYVGNKILRRRFDLDCCDDAEDGGGGAET